MSRDDQAALVPAGQQQLACAGTGETASSALAAAAEAQVKAQYLVALNRPRDLDNVRSLLLKECERSTFAAAAIYSKPVGGKKVTGPSIRFAESAKRIY